MITYIIFSKGVELPRIALVNEDKAVEVKILIYNVTHVELKDVAEFIELDFEEAQESLVTALNEAQSGAMIYAKTLQEMGVSYNQLMYEFNTIAFDYTTTFLTRGDVFVDSKQEPLYLGFSKLYYNITSALVILMMLGLLQNLYVYMELLRKGLVGRLIAVGYKPVLICFTKGVTNAVLITCVLLFIKHLIFTLSKTFILSVSALDVFIVIMNLTTISMIMMALFDTNRNERLTLITSIVVLLFGTYTAGLINSLYLLPKWVQLLNRINLVSIIHGGILGETLNLEMCVVSVTWFIFSIFIVWIGNKMRSSIYA